MGRLPGIPCQDLPRRVQNGSERLGVSVAAVLRNFFEVLLMVEVRIWISTSDELGPEVVVCRNFGSSEVQSIWGAPFDQLWRLLLMTSTWFFVKSEKIRLLESGVFVKVLLTWPMCSSHCFLGCHRRDSGCMRMQWEVPWSKCLCAPPVMNWFIIPSIDYNVL